MSEEKDITLELAEIETHKELTANNEMVFYAISAGVVLCCLFFAWMLHVDDEIQAFVCPATKEMDAPVALQKINDIDQYQAENFLRGFVRQYIRALYPKNSSEAAEHFRFVKMHSLGKIREEYAGYLADAERIGKEFDNGKTTDFFPMHPISDPQSIRMSRADSNTWIVEIPGVMNNRISALEDDRGLATMRLEIIKGKASYEGSYSGLYVRSLDIQTITDPVSNNKKSVR